MIYRSSVIYTCKHTIAAHFKCHLIFRIRHNISVFICNIHCKIRKIFTVCFNRFSVGFYLKFRRRSCRSYRCASLDIFCYFLTVFIPRFCSNCSGFIWNHPCHVQILMFFTALSFAFIHLICISCSRRFLCKFLFAKRSLLTAICRSEEQFYFFCIAVYNYRNFISFFFVHNIFIPCRKNMQCIHTVIPLTLVEVIAVLRKSCRIKNSKIRIFRKRPCATLS